MNNEEIENIFRHGDSWFIPTPFEYQAPQQTTTSIYYERSEFERKVNREISAKIEKLGNMLEVVNNKSNQQFIKGQILALQELQYSIHNNYWEHERNNTMRYPTEY